MKQEKLPIGLYIHVPFCRSKCKYCDFYSLAGKENQKDYVNRVAEVLKEFSTVYPRRADTIYLGGGTPPMLGEEGLSKILETAKECFSWEGGEITCEVNPGRGYPTRVEGLARMGVNRISVGLQTAHSEELACLGRTHSPEDVQGLMERAKQAGISNCSVDLMWGIPHQTVASALESARFAMALEPAHISAYMLKVEQDTPFGKMGEQLVLPGEDTVCEIYEQCCALLESGGFHRYEISNFAKNGMESKHNKKYWNCEETLGIGPAAHSFMEGKRFYYPRSIEEFLAGKPPVSDGEGGDFAEYAMLQLRLTDGLQREECIRRFGFEIPQNILIKAEPFVAHGFMTLDEKGLRFTLKGNLVSNVILAELL